MKKSLLLVAFVAILSTMAYAQPRAIGGRLGYGIEFSYEHGLGKNMLSIDAGFPGLFMNHTIGTEAAVTYDWINPFGATFDKVWDGKGEWNWYMGVGAGLGGYFTHYGSWYTAGYGADWWGNNLFIGAAGRVGVEYNFWFPLQLSVDWRPIIGPSFYTERVYNSDGTLASTDRQVRFNTDALWVGGVSLAVRYKF